MRQRCHDRVIRRPQAAAPDKTAQSERCKPREESRPLYVTDSSGNLVRSSSGAPVAQGTEQRVTVAPPPGCEEAVAPAAPAPKPAPPPDPCAPGQAHTPEQCPELDDDGDGIANAQDRCPLEKGIPATQGCPPEDSDGDGVADHEDRCPDQPGVPDAQGCPPERAEIKVDEATGAAKIDIKEKVFFETGKSAIQPRSFPLLDDVAKLIVANPRTGTISVEGHTDDRGPAELNRSLSLARAEAVKAYLVEKGVDTGRLEAKGYGPDRPAQPNTTAQGREANRRVEFVIVGVEK